MKSRTALGWLPGTNSLLTNSSTSNNKVKLKTPVSQGHRHRGGVKVDPLLQNPSMTRYEEMLTTLTSHAVSSETKRCVLNRAFHHCPSMSMEILGQRIPSLLDSGSMVMLLCETYFKKNILPLLKQPTGDLTKAHSLFWLLAANNKVMPVSKYFEADVTLLGFKIPQVGFPVVKDPSALLKSQCNTQLPGVIGCNLLRLGCEEFKRVYGLVALKEFHHPENINPIIFPRLCSFHQQGKLASSQTEVTNQNLGHINVNTSKVNSEVKRKDPGLGSKSTLG